MNKHIIPVLAALLALNTSGYAQVNNQEAITKLEKQVAVLEAIVQDLTTRLPYRQMAVMTIEATKSNLTLRTSSEGYPYYSNDIKIDNPLSNNNPKAVILVTHQQPGESSIIQDVRAIDVFYNTNDRYWYLRTPDKKISGLHPGLQIEGVRNIGVYQYLFGKELETKEKVSGVAYAEGIHPTPGEKFCVVIFDELDTPMKPKPAPPVETPVTPNEQPPPTPVKVKNPYDIPVDGEWAYKMTSAGGTISTGKVFIVINGTQVTGNLFPPDKSKTAIAGTFEGTTLSLQRETGLQTTQVYELTRTGSKRFAGTYVNRGKYPDSGTIEFYR